MGKRRAGGYRRNCQHLDVAPLLLLLPMMMMTMKFTDGGHDVGHGGHDRHHHGGHGDHGGHHDEGHHRQDHPHGQASRAAKFQQRADIMVVGGLHGVDVGVTQRASR